MYDSFVSTAEPMLVRLLAYRQFHLALRTQPPSRLSIYFLNRNGGSRGIRNVDELIEYMQKANGTRLDVSSNAPATFEEQVRSVAHIDVYVSMHGAAMTNILFMEPLSALIEMNPPKFKEAFYKNMASKANLLFYGIYSTYTENMEYSMREQQTAKILNQWITVPLQLFGKTFDLATKNAWKYKYKMCDYWIVCGRKGDSSLTLARFSLFWVFCMIRHSIDLLGGRINGLDVINSYLKERKSNPARVGLRKQPNEYHFFHKVYSKGGRHRLFCR